MIVSSRDCNNSAAAAAAALRPDAPQASGCQWWRPRGASGWTAGCC